MKSGNWPPWIQIIAIKLSMHKIIYFLPNVDKSALDKAKREGNLKDPQLNF